MFLSSLTPQTLDTVLASAGSKATQAGAGTSLVSFILSSEFGVLVGIMIGFAGLLFQWYFNRRRDLREQEAHEALMRYRDGLGRG